MGLAYLCTYAYSIFLENGVGIYASDPALFNSGFNGCQISWTAVGIHMLELPINHLNTLWPVLHNLPVTCIQMPYRIQNCSIIFSWGI